MIMRAVLRTAVCPYKCSFIRMAAHMVVHTIAHISVFPGPPAKVMHEERGIEDGQPRLRVIAAGY